MKTTILQFKTAMKFRDDIIEYTRLSKQSGNANKETSSIQKSIPKEYIDSFLDLTQKPDIINDPLIIKLSDLKYDVRKLYDTVIDKPIAKVHSACYFAIQGVKRGISTLFSKKTQITLEDVQRILPDYKIPENITNANAKEFLINILNNKQLSDKEIKILLQKRQPIFYRFVSERELRSLKQGNSIQSTAFYNTDMNRTDITSDPKYNFNRYRITFKYNPCWNPFNKNSKVLANDIDSHKWWLFGPYSKKDVVCTERTFFN